MRKKLRKEELFATDALAGPVYAARPADSGKIAALTAARDRPQVVLVLVWPHPGAGAAEPELRRYFALNLPQAVARAAEIAVRLPEQERRAVLAGLRPATRAETERFFRAADILEARMPGPLRKKDLRLKDKDLGPLHSVREM